MDIFHRLIEGQTEIITPLVIFFASLIIVFWLRRLVYSRLEKWVRGVGWEGDEILLGAIRTPSVFWCLIIGAYPALAISPLPDPWKTPAGQGLWTLLLFSITLTMLNLSGKLIPLYGNKLKAPSQITDLIRNVVRVALILLAILIMLGIWGVPIQPLLLVIGAAVLIAVVMFREVVSNLLAWFEIITSRQIKVGDYVKLEMGEEGYVSEINWRSVGVKALDGGIIFIPNSKLVQSKLTNYGRPIKKAKSPFHFYSRVHLKEATGLSAGNLRELTDILAHVPDSVVYYHTHHFLEEHHYLTPQPSNDFAMWVYDALGEEMLSERLAAVDTHDFPTLGALRERFLNIIKEHLSKNPNLRQALPGREFHFIKSISVILPTPYVAHDLREFVEALGKVSIGSLYFHIFEARLRLGKGLNDFSIWLRDSLGEDELADRIAQLDPYVYTLEGLREKLIKLIEGHLK